MADIDITDQIRKIKGVADLLWALSSSEGIQEKDLIEALSDELYSIHDELQEKFFRSI